MIKVNPNAPEFVFEYNNGDTVIQTNNKQLIQVLIEFLNEEEDED